MLIFLNHLINGISLGSVYAIIALGYTMVYGIAKMLNFAHGDVIMVGAYVCFFAVSSYNLPPLAGVVLAVAVCTVLGIVIERLAYKPLRQASSLAVLITAIGVSYLLQNGAQLLWSSNIKMFPSFFSSQPVALFGGQGHAGLLRGQGRRPAHGHQRQRHHLHDLRHRLRPGRHCRRSLLLRLPHPDPHHRRHAGHQGLHRRGVRGHRLHPRSPAGGRAAYISTQLSNAIVFAVLIVVLLVRPTGLLGKQVREKV